MAAPSGTQWGSIAGGKGRIGIYLTSSSTQTQTTVKMQIWFWSKYSVDDSNNTFKYGWASSPNVTIGSKTIKHTVATGGGWSTRNQTHIGTYSKTYNRGKSNTTGYCSASFSDIDVVGASGSVSISFTIPKRNQYSVSYNANGGSGAPSKQTYYYGYDIKLSSKKPTRTGYTFLGWSTSKTATSASYQPGETWSGTNAGNYTLYAVWKRITVTVSYDAGTNGGTVEGGITFSKTYNYGDILATEQEELPVASRKNHKFVGWNTKSDGSGLMVAPNTTVYESITLYAIFELQANCYVRVNGTYKTGMMYKKVNGTYKTGVVSVRANGIYKETNM